jgi:hypothetical protein
MRDQRSKNHAPEKQRDENRKRITNYKIRESFKMPKRGQTDHKSLEQDGTEAFYGRVKTDAAKTKKAIERNFNTEKITKDILADDVEEIEKKIKRNRRRRFLII